MIVVSQCVLWQPFTLWTDYTTLISLVWLIMFSPVIISTADLELIPNLKATRDKFVFALLFERLINILVPFSAKAFNFAKKLFYDL